jgi:phosphatidate cytidylyltransferase
MVALVSMIAAVKLCDTGAYFTGRLIGRHKISPRLSPGKTWEGFVGGVVLAIVGALVVLGPLARSLGCNQSQLNGSWWVSSMVYGLLVATAGVVGDLTISLLKRDAGVKDSSN